MIKKIDLKQTPCHFFLILLIGILYYQNTYAQQYSIDDYAYSSLIEESAKTLQKIKLPAHILSTLTKKDLSDIAVFDANHEYISSLVRKTPNIKELQSKQLKLYKFTKAQTSNIEQTIINKNDNSSIQIKKNTPITDKEVVSHYILKLDPGMSISGLIIDWQQLPMAREAIISIATSNDANNWTDYDRIALRDFNAVNNKEKQTKIKFATSNRYLRLSLMSKLDHFIINSVKGSFSVDHNPKHLWVDQGLISLNTKHDQFYNLPTNIAIDSVEFIFKFNQPNQIIQGDIYLLKDSFSKPTLYLKNITQHNIVDNTTKNTYIKLPTIRNAQWLLKPNMPLRSLPNVILGIAPHELIFLANGQPPYSLYWGNDSETKVLDNGLNKLINSSTLELGNASLNANVITHNLSRLNTQQYHYIKEWFLWLIIFITAGMCLKIAYSLLKEIKSSSN